MSLLSVAATVCSANGDLSMKCGRRCNIDLMASVGRRCWLCMTASRCIRLCVWPIVYTRMPWSCCERERSRVWLFAGLCRNASLSLHQQRRATELWNPGSAMLHAHSVWLCVRALVAVLVDSGPQKTNRRDVGRCRYRPNVDIVCGRPSV